MEGSPSATVCQPSVCFTVERIIGVSHGYGNMKTYQVQWSPSWVSSAHLVGCEKLLQEFLNQHQHQQPNNNEKADLDTGVIAKSTASAEATLKDSGHAMAQQSADHGNNNHSSTLYTGADIFDNSNNVAADGTSVGFPCIEDIKVESTPNTVEKCSSLPHPSASAPLNDGVGVPVLKEEDQMSGDISIGHCNETPVSISEHITKQGPEVVLLDDDSDTEVDNLDYELDIREAHGATQSNETDPNISGSDMQIMAALMSHQHQQHQRQRQQQFQTPYQQQLEQTLEKLYCEICDKPFSCRSIFVRHLRKHTQEKPFECEYCHKSFTRRFTLKKHIRNLHPDMRETDATNEASTGTPVTHDCQLCGEISTSLDDFHEHWKNHHSNSPDALKLLPLDDKSQNEVATTSASTSDVTELT